MTVEAALLMPLILFTIFSTIYLTFYVHNSTALAANAAEIAVSRQEAAPTRYIASSVPDFTVTDQTNMRTVSYFANVFNANDQLFGTLTGKFTYKKCHPTKELRWKRHLKEN